MHSVKSGSNTKDFILEWAENTIPFLQFSLSYSDLFQTGFEFIFQKRKIIIKNPNSNSSKFYLFIKAIYKNIYVLF